MDSGQRPTPVGSASMPAAGTAGGQGGARAETISAGQAPTPYAWALALSPLLTVVVGVPLALAGLGPLAAALARLGAATALIILDRRALSRSDCLPPDALPAVAWLLLPEVYLVKRARRLGRPLTQFWVMLAAEAATLALGVGLVGAAVQSQADAGLPRCADRSSVDDVLAVFGDIPDVRAAGLHGIALLDQTEIAQGPGASPQERVCEGAVEASDTRRYGITYGFEIIQGRIVVRAYLK